MAVDYSKTSYRTEYEEHQVYSAFSGADISCAIYVPPQKLRSLPDQRSNNPKLGRIVDLNNGGGLKIFAEIQTLSISSMRSVDPVRVLGRAEAIEWTRGARTIAGSFIFTDILSDAFADVFTLSAYETSSKYDAFVDQIPPFNIIITAFNEMGVGVTRSIIGVTLVNYGTTYSIDNMMTESTYSYVAEAVTPFMPPDMWRDSVRNILSTSNVDWRKANSASRLRLNLNPPILSPEPHTSAPRRSDITNDQRAVR